MFLLLSLLFFAECLAMPLYVQAYCEILSVGHLFHNALMFPLYFYDISTLISFLMEIPVW